MILIYIINREMLLTPFLLFSTICMKNVCGGVYGNFIFDNIDVFCNLIGIHYLFHERIPEIR